MPTHTRRFRQQFATPVGQGLGTLANALFGNNANRQMLQLQAQRIGNNNVASQLLAEDRAFDMQQKIREQKEHKEAIDYIRNHPEDYAKDILQAYKLDPAHPENLYKANIEGKRDVGLGEAFSKFPINEMSQENILGTPAGQAGLTLRSGQNPNQFMGAINKIYDQDLTRKAHTALKDVKVGDDLSDQSLTSLMDFVGNKQNFLLSDLKKENLKKKGVLTDVKVEKERTYIKKIEEEIFNVGKTGKLIDARTNRVNIDAKIDQALADERITLLKAQEFKVMSSVNLINDKIKRGQTLLPAELELLETKVAKLKTMQQTETFRQEEIKQKTENYRLKGELVPLQKDLYGSKITYWDEKTNTEVVRGDLVAKKIQTEVSKINKNNSRKGVKYQLKKHGETYFGFDPESGKTFNVKMHPDISLGKSDLTSAIVDDGKGGQEVIIYSKSGAMESAQAGEKPEQVSLGTKTPATLREEKLNIKGKSPQLNTRFNRLEWILKNKTVTGGFGGARLVGEKAMKFINKEGDDFATEARTIFKQLGNDMQGILLKGLSPISDRDIKRIQQIAEGGMAMFEGKKDAYRSINFLKEKWDALRVLKGMSPMFTQAKNLLTIKMGDFKRLPNPLFKNEFNRPEVQAIFKAKPNAVYHPMLNFYVIPTNDPKKPFKGLRIPIEKDGEVTSSVVFGSEKFQDFITRNRGR